MRCSDPHVRFGHVVLLFALACCGAAAQDAVPLASTPSYAATARALRSTRRNARPQPEDFRRLSRGDYPVPVAPRVGDEPRLQDYQTICFYLTVVLFAAAIPVHHYW